MYWIFWDSNQLRHTLFFLKLVNRRTGIPEVWLDDQPRKAHKELSCSYQRPNKSNIGIDIFIFLQYFSIKSNNPMMLGVCPTHSLWVKYWIITKNREKTVPVTFKSHEWLPQKLRPSCNLINKLNSSWITNQTVNSKIQTEVKKFTHKSPSMKKVKMKLQFHPIKQKIYKIKPKPSYGTTEKSKFRRYN